MNSEPTFNGRTISDEEFDAMADDVAAKPPTFSGEPRRRGHPVVGDTSSRVAQVRLSAADYDAVVQAAKDRGESISEFLRRTALEATRIG